MIFYVGLSTQRQIDYIKNKFMLSFQRIRKRKSMFNIKSDNWIMDSGAYSELKMYGKYTYDLDSYLNQVLQYDPNIFVTCDYMCEPEQIKKTGLSVKKHQLLTIENQVKIFEKKKDMGIKSDLMGVFQGWKLEDYLEHIDMIKEKGILLKHMGVGSVCRRHKTKNIVNILDKIKRNLPDWVKLHGFGVKVQAFKYPQVFRYLHSADSMAWCYAGRGIARFGVNGILFGKKCLAIPNNICNKKSDDCANCEIFMGYWVKKIEKTIKDYNNQKKLGEYF